MVTLDGNAILGILPKFNWTELKDNPAKDEQGWYFV